MAKKGTKDIFDALVPLPTEVTTPVIEGEISNLALRRQKVRELYRLGFDPKRISMILEKGVKGRDGKIITFPCSFDTIRNDLAYIAQEAIAEDTELITKRIEILDKLHYLYNQAMIAFTNANKGSSQKNSFLITAASILDKIVELEGLSSPKAYDIKMLAETRTSAMADEVRKLPKEDRDAIIATIRNISKRHNAEGVGRNGVLSDTPRISAPSSEDAGIFREPPIRKGKRQTKTSQQKGSN